MLALLRPLNESESVSRASACVGGLSLLDSDKLETYYLGQYVCADFVGTDPSRHKNGVD